MSFLDGFQKALLGVNTLRQNCHKCQKSEIEGEKSIFGNIGNIVSIPATGEESGTGNAEPDPDAPLFELPELYNEKGEFCILRYLERWGAVFTLKGNDFLSDLSGIASDGDREGAERVLSSPESRKSILSSLRLRLRTRGPLQ